MSPGIRPARDTLFKHQSSPGYEARIRQSIREAEGKLFIPEHDSFLKERIVLLEGMIDDEVTHLAIAEIFFLEYEDSTAPIHLFIDSDGGQVAASLAIYDVVSKQEFPNSSLSPVKSPIFTYCRGRAHGTAAMIVAAGERGHRHALPTSRLSIVPIYTPPDAQDPSYQEKERVLSQMVEVMIEHTAQSEDSIRDAFMHGRSFTANEAKEYGLVDAISD